MYLNFLGMEYNISKLVNVRPPTMGQHNMAHTESKETNAEFQPVPGIICPIPANIRLYLFDELQ